MSHITPIARCALCLYFFYQIVAISQAPLQSSVKALRSQLLKWGKYSFARIDNNKSLHIVLSLSVCQNIQKLKIELVKDFGPVSGVRSICSSLQIAQKLFD